MHRHAQTRAGNALCRHLEERMVKRITSGNSMQRLQAKHLLHNTRDRNHTYHLQQLANAAQRESRTEIRSTATGSTPGRILGQGLGGHRGNVSAYWGNFSTPGQLKLLGVPSVLQKGDVIAITVDTASSPAHARLHTGKCDAAGQSRNRQ